ncbi:biopolymer transporter ExbD [bacterium]|nr:biopolymer transporter ExbD [bacterium]
MGIGSSKCKVGNPITSINVAPLVDVCLVLVIIFMVTAPLIAQNGILVNSIKKEVGDQGGKSSQPEVETIYLKVTDKKIELNGRAVRIKRLSFKLQELLELNQEKAVYINAVGKVRYGRVVDILDITRQSGAKRLALLNDQEGLLERTLVFQKKRR